MYSLVSKTFYPLSISSKKPSSYLEEYCQTQYGNPKEITITNIPIRGNSHGRRVLNKLYEGIEPPEEYYEGSLSDVSCKDPHLLQHGLEHDKLQMNQVFMTIIVESDETILSVHYKQTIVPFRLQPGWICSFVQYYSRFPLHFPSSLFTASFYHETKNVVALSIPFFQLVVKPQTSLMKKNTELYFILKKVSSSTEQTFSLHCIREVYDLDVLRYDLQCPESSSAMLKLSEVKPMKKKTGTRTLVSREDESIVPTIKRKKTLSVMNAKQTDLLQGCSTYFSTLLQAHHLMRNGKVKFTEQIVEDYRNLVRTCISQYSSSGGTLVDLLQKKIEVCNHVVGWLKTMRQLDESLVKPDGKRERDTVVPRVNEKVSKQGEQVGEVNVRIFFKRSPSGVRQIQIVLENTKSLGWMQRQSAKETNCRYFKECYEKMLPASQKRYAPEVPHNSSSNITMEDLFGDSSSDDESSY
jgi:hypothetical protein